MSTTSKLGADMTDFQINLLASHYWEIKEVMGVRTDKFDAVGFARALLDRQPAPSVEQDERGALIRAFDASLSGVPRYVIDRFGVEHVADGGGWIKESDLFDRFAASTSANVAQLDMSLEARLTDAEADVKRLHAEKMELWNQVHGYAANVAQLQSVDLPPRVIDQLYQAAGVSTYHPDGDQQEKLHAFARNVVAETLARLPTANVAQGAERLPDENSPEFQAACSMALKASEAGVGPCGVFMAGYRTLRGVSVDVGDPVRFKSTSCSQCGKDLGPANSGTSHCEDHS